MSHLLTYANKEKKTKRKNTDTILDENGTALMDSSKNLKKDEKSTDMPHLNTKQSMTALLFYGQGLVVVLVEVVKQLKYNLMLVLVS